MQEQIKSGEISTQKDQPNFGKTESQFNGQNNKTYDDCDTQKGLVSLLMKIIPIVLYLIFKLATDSHLGLFILIVLLLAVDFWTTKNILGPKLVALKWFSIEDQNQNQKMCFSTQENRVVSKINALFFWAPQIFAIIFWLVIIFINMITLGLFWVGLAFFSQLLLIINFAFFIQCKGDHQKKVSFLAGKFGFNIYNDQRPLNSSIS